MFPGVVRPFGVVKLGIHNQNKSIGYLLTTTRTGSLYGKRLILGIPIDGQHHGLHDDA